MTPNPRTPQLRDRRFARVRLLSNSIFLVASALSAGMVAYFASTAVAHTSNPQTTTTTTATGGGNGGGGTTPTTTRPTPTTVATVPVTTPTVCHTSASGTFLGCW